MKCILLTLCLMLITFSNPQILGAKVNPTTEDGALNQKAEKLLPGVYAAALTPMHEDYSCNCEEFANHCESLIHRGCKGVVLFGSSGEGPSFSVAEREDAIKKLIGLGIDPQKIIVGVICCAIDDTIKLASVAIEQQCSAVLIAPPFYYKKMDDAGVIAFYRKVIREINHPNVKILLYHIPQLSYASITPTVIKTLREEFPDNVIGVKDSEDNLAFTKEILSTFPDLQVFVGNDLHITETVQLGGSGGISGIANAYPELICSLYAFGKDQQQPDNNKIAQDISRTIKTYPTFPSIKKTVEKQKGSSWHVLRPPLTPLDEEQSKALTEALKNLI